MIKVHVCVLQNSQMCRYFVTNFPQTVFIHISLLFVTLSEMLMYSTASITQYLPQTAFIREHYPKAMSVAKILNMFQKSGQNLVHAVLSNHRQVLSLTQWTY